MFAAWERRAILSDQISALIELYTPGRHRSIHQSQSFELNRIFRIPLKLFQRLCLSATGQSSRKKLE